LHYRWSPDSGLSTAEIADPLVSIGESRTYTVTVINEAGCTAQQTLTVNVQEREDIRAEIVGQNEKVEPGESSAITFQIWSRFKELNSFKAAIHYDSAVFQYIPNSAAFLLGSVNNWQISAEESQPGKLLISANGSIPVQTAILGFEITAYLARQTDPNLILKLEEVNGAPVLVESHCMEIQVKSAELTLDDICAGDLRLINISSVQTELQAITPNPVTNNVVQIYYSVAIPGDISLEIYNQQGSAFAIPEKG